MYSYIVVLHTISEDKDKLYLKTKIIALYNIVKQHFRDS